MKKSWLKPASWLALVVGTWGIGVAANAASYQGEVGWLVSIYRQKVALAQSIHAPKRVLLVGGSATHFGVDATQLEQQLKTPVINFGLHAGLGLDAILATAQPEIRPGDVVVVFPEYRILANEDGDHNRIMTLLFGMQIGNFAVGESDLKQQVNKTVLLGSLGVKNAISLVKLPQAGQQGYSPDVSERGDARELPVGKVAMDKPDETVSPYSLNQLRTFRQQVEQKGARLVFGLPWRFARADSQSKMTVQAIVTVLSPIAPVIYDRTSLNLKTDPQLFGDTPYHLSLHGRMLRSREIAQQLGPLL